MAMLASLLNGNTSAARLRVPLFQEIAALKDPLCLAVIWVGNNPASDAYIRNKCRVCAELGMHSRAFHFPQSATERELLSLIDTLNQDKTVDGILVQLPLPEHFNVDRIIEQIDPYKDVDGFHPYNLGRLAQNKALFRPCTSLGVLHLLNFYRISLAGQHIVIVGSSNIVGKPMAYEAVNAGATVTQCNKNTRDLFKKIKDADILISATGQANLIPSIAIKPAAVIIDIGFNRLKNGQLIGDVDFENARKVASWITPVPGGVGPMTVVCLCMNTLEARYAAQHRYTSARAPYNEPHKLDLKMLRCGRSYPSHPYITG